MNERDYINKGVCRICFGEWSFTELGIEQDCPACVDERGRPRPKPPVIKAGARRATFADPHRYIIATDFLEEPPE